MRRRRRKKKDENDGKKKWVGRKLGTDHLPSSRRTAPTVNESTSVSSALLCGKTFHTDGENSWLITRRAARWSATMRSQQHVRPQRKPRRYCALLNGPAQIYWQPSPSACAIAIAELLPPSRARLYVSLLFDKSPQMLPQYLPTFKPALFACQLITQIKRKLHSHRLLLLFSFFFVYLNAMVVY